MKPLDDYIREKLDRFNTEEPLRGHFERFDRKLAQTDKSRVNRSLFMVLKIAAILIMGIIISYTAFREFRLANQKIDRIVSAQASPEFQEAEQYYSSQLSYYYEAFHNLEFNNNKAEKKQIWEELSEMDKQVRTMKLDLIQNPDDERIVHAIINFYQVKIEFMDMIIARTQESTNAML